MFSGESWPLGRDYTIEQRWRHMGEKMKLMMSDLIDGANGARFEPKCQAGKLHA